MANRIHTWQLISLVLAVALAAALIELHHNSPKQHLATGTLTRSVNSSQDFERLALSPNARRANERFSL